MLFHIVYFEMNSVARNFSCITGIAKSYQFIGAWFLPTTQEERKH